jgi:glycerol-3-phosphate dehydrogenase subunit B
MLDAVVVGGGLAGMSAAVRLAQAGRRVLMIAKGAGSTLLSGGTIDVLGYAPERVESPRRALPELAAERPEHPYARLPVETVEDSLDWFRGATGSLGYIGGLDENLLLPTAAGVPRPTALVAGSMAAGDLRRHPKVLVAGFRALKDFFADYVADNLRLAGIEARAIVLAASPQPREADVSAPGFARALDDDPDFARRVAEQLAIEFAPGEVIGMPALLGLSRAPEVWSELQERVGTAIFEIPTLPPSVPGLRVQRRLDELFRQAGGRSILGIEAVSFERSNGSVTAIVVQDAARRRPYRARSFVLATGGFATGGLVLDEQGEVREPVLGLPVSGIPADGSLFGAGYFDSHPLSLAGIAVDDSLRPLADDGRPVFDNVHVVGAMLAGAEPWKEKSGDGISLASGYRAAGVVLEEGS